MANGVYFIELFLFILATLSSVTGYERCTYGTVTSYYQCYSGRCCQINGSWYCVHGSLKQCTHLAETTKTPWWTVYRHPKKLTTTLKPRTMVLDDLTYTKHTILPVTVSLIVLSTVVLFIVFVICVHKKRHCHSSNRTVQRRTQVTGARSRNAADNYVFFMEGAGGSNGMHTMPDIDFSRCYLPPRYDEIDHLKPPAYSEVVQQTSMTTHVTQQITSTSDPTTQHIISSSNPGTTDQIGTSSTITQQNTFTNEQTTQQITSSSNPGTFDQICTSSNLTQQNTATNEQTTQQTICSSNPGTSKQI